MPVKNSFSYEHSYLIIKLKVNGQLLMKLWSYTKPSVANYLGNLIFQLTAKSINCTKENRIFFRIKSSYIISYLRIFAEKIINIFEEKPSIFP